jgi:hypothetical protein
VLKEEGQIEGKLTDVGLESIMLEVNTSEIVDIPFEDISESFVQISF